MADPLRNFFKSTLVGTYSNSATSLTIATGDGALLPDPSTDGAFNLTIFEGLQVTGSTSFEIVRVTARSGDVLTVTRGAESTTPLTIGSATHSILMSATKKTFDDINTAIDNVNVTTLTGVEELTFDSTGDEEFGLPAGTTAQRPASPDAGYMRWNSTDSRIEVYNGTRWAGLSEIGLEQVSLGIAQLSVTANDAVFEAVVAFFGGRGLFGGGKTNSGSTESNVIDYITIDTTGNATDFGDLSTSKNGASGCSNGTRGLFGGGGDAIVNVIDYITIATTGNATDFGDLTESRYVLGSCSDGTTGVFGGGYSGSASNTIDYVTIDTTGNAQDFGDLTVARYGVSGCSNDTRGVFGGGYSTNYVNTIDYITIATTGNAVDFGDLVNTTYAPGACSDGSRGLFGGGETPTATNVINYITIDTAGNATDFGDLTLARWTLAGCSDGSRGVFGGGLVAGGAEQNVIDYVTIQTTGNATDFGDLTVSRRFIASCSGD